MTPAAVSDRPAEKKKTDKVAAASTGAGIPHVFTQQEIRCLMQLKALHRPRFMNTTEKNARVWKDIAQEFNRKAETCMDGTMHCRTQNSLQSKFDNLLSAARRHNLRLSKVNGTRGGSGNATEDVEAVEASQPPYFIELREAGFLEGPLGNKMNVLNNQTSIEVLDCTADLDDELLGYGGEDMPPTQEPIAGRKEAAARAEKVQSMSGSQSTSIGSGQQRKKRTKLKMALEAQAAHLDSATQATATSLTKGLHESAIEIYGRQREDDEKRMDRVLQAMQQRTAMICQAIDNGLGVFWLWP